LIIFITPILIVLYQTLYGVGLPVVYPELPAYIQYCTKTYINTLIYPGFFSRIKKANISTLN